MVRGKGRGCGVAGGCAAETGRKATEQQGCKEEVDVDDHGMEAAECCFDAIVALIVSGKQAQVLGK